MIYPDALHLAAVDLARKQHDRISGLEAELKLLEEMNAQLRDQNTEVDQACARRETIEAAARKVVAAFEALGTAQHAGAMLIERGNCETAMVALNAALFNTEGQRP